MNGISTPHTETVTIEGNLTEVDVVDQGNGPTFLLLHGGAGPQSVAGFADLLTSELPARVVTPVHPGFNGTPRPDHVSDIRSLARVYSALIDELDLHDVTVIGNSVGGWIAAELALLANPRVGRVVLVNAVGLRLADSDRRLLLPDDGSGR